MSLMLFRSLEAFELFRFVQKGEDVCGAGGMGGWWWRSGGLEDRGPFAFLKLQHFGLIVNCDLELRWCLRGFACRRGREFAALSRLKDETHRVSCPSRSRPSRNNNGRELHHDGFIEVAFALKLYRESLLLRP